MSPPVLEMRDVSKSFAAPLAAGVRVAALEGVSLLVHRGEVLGIVGPPGAGKSTLLRCAAGLLRPDEGTITGAGVGVDVPSVEWLRSVGHYPPRITPRELLALAPALRPLIPGERAARVEEALRAFALQSRADRPLVHLGPDSESRVALAVALSSSPALLVIDPAADGESALSACARGLLLSRVESGLAVLAAARDRRALSAPPDRVLLLVSGRVRAELSVKRPAPGQRRKRSAARASDSSWSARA